MYKSCCSGLQLAMCPARLCWCSLPWPIEASSERCVISQPPSYLPFQEEESSPFFGSGWMLASTISITLPLPSFKLLTISLAGRQ